MPRCAIYTRISDDRTGEGAGVERQLEECTRLTSQLGCTDPVVFSDNDISAFKGRRRPGFEALLKAMQDGAVDVLVVWHVDRLYRSLKDLERLIDIAEPKGVAINTATSGEMDLSTSAGRMVARILGSVARQESEHHSERRRAANAERAKKGQWNANCGRTFGFNGDGTHREPEAEMIRRAADGILNRGQSLRAIARDWNEAGVTTVRGKPWTNLFIRRVLSCPRIGGIVVHRGQVLDVPAQWEPIISQDTFHRLQSFLSEKNSRGVVSFERSHMMSGVILCGRCGAKMTTIVPSRGRPVLYACRPTNHVSVRATELDDFMESLLLEYLNGEGVGRSLRVRDKKQKSLAEKREKLRTERADLSRRLDELAGLFAGGQITGTQLATASASLKEQVHNIDTQLAASVGVDPLAALGADGAVDAEVLVERWAAASADVRSKIVKKLLVVTALPRPKGSRGFDPDAISVQWR